MREAEGINFSVGPMGPASERPAKISRMPRGNPTLQEMTTFIQRLDLGESDKNHLLGLLKKTPHGSFANFRRNYRIYLKNK